MSQQARTKKHRKRGLPLALAFIMAPALLMAGCSKATPEPSPTPTPATSPAHQSGSPAPEAEGRLESPTPGNAAPMTDAELILAFFPKSSFIMEDGRHYSDLTMGHLLSVGTVLPAGGDIYFAVLKKESVFPAVGFITHYAALVDAPSKEIVSDTLVIPGKEPDTHATTPLPEFRGSYVPIYRDGEFSLLICMGQTDHDKRESYQAGLWTVRGAKWVQRWPDAPFGSEAYAAWWQDRKAEISESGVTLFTRPARPTPGPSPEPSGGPPPQAPDIWTQEEALGLESLLPSEPG